MKFPQRLTSIMESCSVSAYRMSKETGLSDTQISYYKSGKNDPTGENLIKLADYFNVSVDYLLGRTDNPEVNR